MVEFYSNAARVIDKILQKKGTPKTLVIENKNVRNKKKLYALVCEALKYKSVTDQLLKETKLISIEKQLRYPMALVLVYDYLFGRGLQVGGQLKQVINRNKTSLQAELARMKVRTKVVNNEDLLPQNVKEQQEMQIPRYVRVNTLKTSTDDVITWFSRNGFKEIKQVGTGSTQIPRSQSFSVDQHIPDLLVFPPGTDLHDNALYHEGKIILQDKASCFPAFVLNPPSGSIVVDACAAPGNKTSHLAAMMKNEGKIFAFDISEKRISTMKKLLQRTGEKIVETKHEDFLKADPTDPVYKKVQYILIDPSCSGSGIISRLDYVTNEMDTKEKQRIQSLANFQVKALTHALSFPNVKRVVYSTCSLHEMENEEVVRKVLEKFHEKFELETALPEWSYRGHTLFPDASKCVRAAPKEGSTSGFFLALFVTKGTERTSMNDNHKVTEIQTDICCNEIKSNKRKRRHNIDRNLEKTTRQEENIIPNNETNLLTRKRKRMCVTDSIETDQVKKKKTYRSGATGVPMLRRKCSEKEFEYRLARKHKNCYLNKRPDVSCKITF